MHFKQECIDFLWTLNIESFSAGPLPPLKGTIEIIRMRI